MSAGYWRKHARPIVTRVLAETAGRPEKEIRAALRDAYPFGERKYHPYKVWLDEVRTQRFGAKKHQPLGPCACGHPEESHDSTILSRRCYAADCACAKYDPAQAALAGVA